MTARRWQNEVPIEKVFTGTLRDKFPWAMSVPPNWTFNLKGEHLRLKKEREPPTPATASPPAAARAAAAAVAQESEDDFADE